MEYKIIKLKCPKCGNIYEINEWEIDYRYCCDDCNIILYPKDEYGKEG